MITAGRCRFCRLERRWFDMPGSPGVLVSTTEAGKDCQAPDNLHRPCRPRTDQEIADDELAAATRRRLLFGKSRPANGRG